VETVTGGFGNTYKLTGNGQFNVNDFNINSHDVLDLHGLLAPLAGVYSLWTQSNGSGVDIFMTTHNATRELASLHGTDVTLANLVATHTLVT
jgi:hypothetical protein